jgi:NhaP-type Na+/H+ or K+/H+ antiporter
MSELSVITVAACVLLYALISRRLESGPVTPPLAFLAIGVLLGPYGAELIVAPGSNELVRGIAEITLILVLFADATRIDLTALRRGAGLPIRLLGVGLALTMALGAALALLCVPGITIWEAALLAAVLAPTDAALGQVVVNSKLVPERIRQALNVESGLNDGFALPVVLVFASLASVGSGAEEEVRSTAEWAVYTGKQLLLGPLAGAGLGALGALLATAARKHNLMNEAFEKLAAVAMALLSFELAEAIGGNGFIAAFVAGMALGNLGRDFSRCVHEFLEAEGQLLMLLVFMSLGAAFALPAFAHATPSILLYVVLSLTVIRMVPVSLSLLGTKLQPASHLFLGWFGPRGLATFLYGLLVIDESSAPHRELLFAVAIITVIFSIIAHGVTAAPGVRAYARAIERNDNTETLPELHEVVHRHATRSALFDNDKTRGDP